MNYYVIGIGGTGAKCVEALTHLCAAGMMPDGDLYVLFVDPDKSNGSLERSQITLQQYINCKQLRLGEVKLFKNSIERAKPDLWSPFGDKALPNLGDFFQYNTLKGNNKSAAYLFDVLYSSKERETTLDKGFRGHPSIGAAVLAKTVELGKGDPWGTLWRKIEQDRKAKAGAKIFLFASVFGGTGASGFPTLAKLIKKELVKETGDNKQVKETSNDGGQQPTKVQLGGALILPYFSFVPDETDELKASSENFLMNTQVALKYYYQQNSGEFYDARYLFGDESLSPVDFSLGARTQKNEPHFIELYAALAAIDFFTKENPTGYNLLARQNGNALEWTDLPDGNNGNTVKGSICQIARFAFAYMTAYKLMLDDIRSKGGGYRAPWFVNFFTRQNILIEDNAIQTALENVNSYCKSFLQWLADVQTSARDEKINLIRWSAFAETINGKTIVKKPQNFTLRDYGNLILPIIKEKPHALNNLWERISNAKVRDSHVDDSCRFVHALYKECAK